MPRFKRHASQHQQAVDFFQEAIDEQQNTTLVDNGVKDAMTHTQAITQLEDLPDVATAKQPMSTRFVAGTLLTLEDGAEILVDDVKVGMHIQPQEPIWASVSAADGEMVLKTADKFPTVDADGECYDVIQAIEILDCDATVAVYNLTTDRYPCDLDAGALANSLTTACPDYHFAGDILGHTDCFNETTLAAGGPDELLVAQLLLMGVSENGAKRACFAVQNASADVAASWYFDHMDDADINDPLPAPGSGGGGGGGGCGMEADPGLVPQLSWFGFGKAHVEAALKMCMNLLVATLLVALGLVAVGVVLCNGIRRYFVPAQGKDGKESKELMDKEHKSPAYWHPCFNETTLATGQPDELLVAQLLSMGVSENGAKRACFAVQNAGADVAADWYFHHMDDADINDPLPAPGSGGGGGGGGGGMEADPELVPELCSFGFSKAHVEAALKTCMNSPERAADWLFSHAGDLDSAVAALGDGDSGGVAASPGGEGEGYEDGVGSGGGGGGGGGGMEADPGLVPELCSLGFGKAHVEAALKTCRNSSELAANWLFWHADDLDSAVAALGGGDSGGVAAPAGGEGQGYEDGVGDCELVGSK